MAELNRDQAGPTALELQAGAKTIVRTRGAVAVVLVAAAGACAVTGHWVFALLFPFMAMEVLFK